MNTLATEAHRLTPRSRTLKQILRAGNLALIVRCVRPARLALRLQGYGYLRCKNHGKSSGDLTRNAKFTRRQAISVHTHGRSERRR